jgi:hypothetical protein
MQDLAATLLGLYLLLTLPPVVVAWRRELPARTVRRAAIWGVLFGWTVIGALAAWLLAFSDKPQPGFTVTVRTTLER